VKTFTVFSAAAVLAVLAGCGSSNSNTTTSSGSASTATQAAATTPSAYGRSATNPAAGTGAAGSGVVITVKHGKPGTILAAGPHRLTVYMFEGDKGAASSCTGACASAWPPVTSTGAVSGAGGASAAMISTITRSDGTKQVTYNGHPLYFFTQDKDAGDAYGQGVKAFGADWYVVAPTGQKVDNS
jgi:predicted lipoprotein with Yx(FWY)xxD motif